VSGVNYLAVLVAAVLNMVVGALWYSPALFGKSWLALMGWKPEDAQQRMAGSQRAYALTFVASLLMAYGLARVLAYAQTFTLTGGVLIGLLAWIGFVATSQGTSYLFEGRSFRLYTINTGYHLASLVLMGALLGVWR
jgi:hypothetical protein